MKRELSYPDRREFLKVFGAAGSLAVGGKTLLTQTRHKFPEPPSAADPNNTAQPRGQMAQRAQLKMNEQEFRESLSRLHERVNELKQDVDALHTADVFSVKVYKQTGEIEQLAKRLRNLAKI